MLAKTADPMMVLSVYVIRNGTANGGKSRAGQYWRKKAARKESLQQIAKGHPRLHDHLAAAWIE